jgi:hypothetical protein
VRNPDDVVQARPNAANRREISAYIRRKIILRRIDDYCEHCSGPCKVLTPQELALNIRKVRVIVDHVLHQEPHAGIHIRRGREHEFMVHVECVDETMAEQLNTSPACHQGVWFRAEVLRRSNDAQATSSLARDYVEGRADAIHLLAAMEAGQDMGPEDNEQGQLAQPVDKTHSTREPGPCDDE